MSIYYTSGDLMLNPHEAQALALGVNAMGIMNTQLGVKFRTRYPMMYQEYVTLCHAEPREFDLGGVWLWQAPDGKYVFNLAVHENEFYMLASPKIIEQAFHEMRRLAEENEITVIGMPPIGGGIGLLNWSNTKKGLERAFRKWDGKLFVYVKRPREEQRKKAYQASDD